MKKISYGRQSIDSRDIKAVVDVLKSDFLTQGPKVVEFEKKLAQAVGAKYAVVVSNGTAALHIACLALELKNGSEGITSGITFVASANAIEYAGAHAKFCDIDPQTFNLDPQKLEKIISSKTKVIIPVHFAGQPCDMKAIYGIAQKRKVKIIEDASHAIGSKIGQQPIGNCRYSDMTTFSFHPVKNITTGEGGAITTNNAALYEKLLLLRNHGLTKNPKLLTKNEGPWYYQQFALGFNYRMTDFQSALGISQLSKLKKFNTRRNTLAKIYQKHFRGLPGVSFQKNPASDFSAYHLFVLLIDFKKFKTTRNALFKALNVSGIFPQVHYIPVYHQPYYRKRESKTRLPQCEKFYAQAVSLPLYPDLNENDILKVIKSIKKFLKIS